MKNLFICLSTLCVTFLSVGLYSEDNQIRDNVTGDAFPRHISFEHNGTTYNLEATGVATRKKFFVKIYSIASYLQDYKLGSNADVAAEIMNDNKAKQLTIKWFHEASAQQIQNGYIESFHNSLDMAAFNSIQNEINSFVQLFNVDAKKGDELMLRWIPGGTVEVIINGKTVKSITSLAFAKALWDIWFGPNSVVDRARLIGNTK